MFFTDSKLKIDFDTLIVLSGINTWSYTNNGKQETIEKLDMVITSFERLPYTETSDIFKSFINIAKSLKNQLTKKHMEYDDEYVDVILSVYNFICGYKRKIDLEVLEKVQKATSILTSMFILRQHSYPENLKIGAFHPYVPTLKSVPSILEDSLKIPLIQTYRDVVRFKIDLGIYCLNESCIKRNMRVVDALIKKLNDLKENIEFIDI